MSYEPFFASVFRNELRTSENIEISSGLTVLRFPNFLFGKVMPGISFFPIVRRSKMRIHLNKTRKFFIAFGTGANHWDFFDQIVMFQSFPPYSSVQ